MKLKKSESKKLKKYSYSYSKTVLIIFAFLYLILPIFLQKVVGDDFYIYSKFQSFVTVSSIFFFFLICLLVFYVSRIAKGKYRVNIRPPDNKSYLFFYWANIIYMFLIIIRGFILRLNGISRIELLSSLSSQLIPGYGYLLLLSCIATLHINKRFNLILFILLSLLIDITYQGKIFSTNAFMLLMFYLDINYVKMSIKRLCAIGGIGLFFLFVIFAIRAMASGGNLFVDVYSFFSEFMGVHATIGWGYDYNQANMPMRLTHFDEVLQNYYMGSVGHGLALSPVAYFIGNFGIYNIPISILYTILLILIYYTFSLFLGRFTLYVFMYNFIHLLRHGPNIFLQKSISHMLLLSIILIIFCNYVINKNNALNENRC